MEGHPINLDYTERTYSFTWLPIIYLTTIYYVLLFMVSYRYKLIGVNTNG